MNLLNRISGGQTDFAVVTAGEPRCALGRGSNYVAVQRDNEYCGFYWQHAVFDSARIHLPDEADGSRVWRIGAS
jgi:hypothetical protein